MLILGYITTTCAVCQNQLWVRSQEGAKLTNGRLSPETEDTQVVMGFSGHLAGEGCSGRCREKPVRGRPRDDVGALLAPSYLVQAIYPPLLPILVLLKPSASTVCSPTLWLLVPKSPHHFRSSVVGPSFLSTPMLQRNPRPFP